MISSQGNTVSIWDLNLEMFFGVQYSKDNRESVWKFVHTQNKRVVVTLFYSTSEYRDCFQCLFEIYRQSTVKTTPKKPSSKTTLRLYFRGCWQFCSRNGNVKTSPRQHLTKIESEKFIWMLKHYFKTYSSSHWNINVTHHRHFTLVYLFGNN